MNGTEVVDEDTVSALAEAAGNETASEEESIYFVEPDKDPHYLKCTLMMLKSELEVCMIYDFNRRTPRSFRTGPSTMCFPNFVKCLFRRRLNCASQSQQLGDCLTKIRLTYAGDQLRQKHEQPK